MPVLLAPIRSVHMGVEQGTIGQSRVTLPNVCQLFYE